MADPRSDRCETCRFFQRGVDDDGWERGQCRRRAPVLIQLHFSEHFREEWGEEHESDREADCHQRIFPRVFNTDWCGEWQGLPL